MKYNDLETAFITSTFNKLLYRTHFKHTWDIECKSQEQRRNNLIYQYQYTKDSIEYDDI